MIYDKEELMQSLKEAYNYCDYKDSNGFTFSIKVSGAEGGNCYGDYATEFRVSENERVDEIQGEIVSGVNNFLSMLKIDLPIEELHTKAYSVANELVDGSYDSTHHSEYYGNHSTYDKFFVSIDTVLDFADNLISPKEKEEILSISKEVQDEVVAEKTKEIQYNALKETEKKILNFKTSSSQEETQIKSQLERSKKDVEALTKKLSNLEKTQEKNLASLEKVRDNLTQNLGKDYIKSKERNKRKNGY